MANALFNRKKQDVDMTQGNVARHLLVFAFPLLLGNLFQQFYNMVDSWVVGNFVSNEAFAAVGTVAPITSMLINFFAGLTGGANVVIAQYYGARRYDKVHDTVHTFVFATLIMCAIFTTIGLIFTPTLLTMMGTDPAVMPESTTYLKIYFAGLSGLLLYNMGSGILRAVGDSRRPFFFLVVSALLNIVLDLVFVLALGMGVDGVAYATIISQFVSAGLVVLALLKTTSCVQLIPSALHIDRELIRSIFRVGLPSAIQMSFTSFSNIFVQSYIYQFGADCMSGWAAYSKIDQLVILPMGSLGIATSTFVGQNLGNRDLERAKKGVRTAHIISFSITVFLSLVVVLTAPHLVSFFNDKPEVVEYGTFFLRIMCSLFFLPGINTIYTAAQRGSGNSRVPMVIMLVSYVFFRQAYLFVVSNFISNTLIPITFGYPAGWMVAALLSFLYYKKVGIQKSRLMEDVHSGN